MGTRPPHLDLITDPLDRIEVQCLGEPTGSYRIVPAARFQPHLECNPERVGLEFRDDDGMPFVAWVKNDSEMSGWGRVFVAALARGYPDSRVWRSTSVHDRSVEFWLKTGAENGFAMRQLQGREEEKLAIARELHLTGVPTQHRPTHRETIAEVESRIAEEAAAPPSRWQRLLHRAG